MLDGDAACLRLVQNLIGDGTRPAGDDDRGPVNRLIIADDGGRLPFRQIHALIHKRLLDTEIIAGRLERRALGLRSICLRQWAELGRHALVADRLERRLDLAE